MVDGLMLVDLHTGAHVAFPMQEESEGAGKMLTADKKMELFGIAKMWYAQNKEREHRA